MVALLTTPSEPQGGNVSDLATNVLNDGENLDILGRYLPDGTDAQLLAFEGGPT